MGLKPSQAKQLGVKGSINNVPSIDRAATACAAKVGDPRLTCYAALDRVLSTQIVPDPVHVGEPGQRHRSKVDTWSFDQNAGLAGFAHASLKR